MSGHGRSAGSSTGTHAVGSVNPHTSSSSSLIAKLVHPEVQRLLRHLMWCEQLPLCWGYVLWRQQLGLPAMHWHPLHPPQQSMNFFVPQGQFGALTVQ